jgi:hypothetical protein
LSHRLGACAQREQGGDAFQIDPLLDDMLPNYPEVDMGKAQKTAANEYLSSIRSPHESNAKIHCRLVVSLAPQCAAGLR